MFFAVFLPTYAFFVDVLELSSNSNVLGTVRFRLDVGYLTMFDP